jgi:hypothetical protein
MKSLVLIPLLILVLTAPPAMASGPDVTGGGDVIVMKFKNAARQFCHYLQFSKDSLPFSTQSICDAVANVSVSVEDRLYLDDGTEVDALNIPAKQEIKLSLKRNEIKFDGDFFYLAPHEYISVIGVDDKDYKVSGPLILKMGLNEEASDTPTLNCPTINAEYECPVEVSGSTYPSKVKVDIGGNTILYPQVTYPDAKPWVADGIERLSGFFKRDSHYDHDDEEYTKATCLTDGLKLETRNTNFECDDQSKPSYQCRLQGRSWEYKKYRFNSDASVMMVYRKGTVIYLSGKVSNQEGKQVCNRINK